MSESEEQVQLAHLCYLTRLYTVHCRTKHINADVPKINDAVLVHFINSAVRVK